MSICRNYYVIAGYDLTAYKTDKYEEWKWSASYENMICNQIKGKVQIFDDPMCGDYVYLGYILAAGDQYDFETSMFSESDIRLKESEVYAELHYLMKHGIISDEAYTIPYQIIVFEECT